MEAATGSAAGGLHTPAPCPAGLAARRCSRQLPDFGLQRAAFVATHLQRIAATKRYAEAQDNNHWISEAAAMFIGGSWLAAFASAHAHSGRQWAAEDAVLLNAAWRDW